MKTVSNIFNTLTVKVWDHFPSIKQNCHALNAEHSSFFLTFTQSSLVILDCLFECVH